MREQRHRPYLPNPYGSEMMPIANATPTLRQFLEYRLEKRTKEVDMLKEMLVRSFGANSFHEFWHYWNPVYGYYLYYKCYKPLKKHLPRQLCVILTFAASGFFLHDLPFGWWIRFFHYLQTGDFPIPFVTIWFTLMGAVTLTTRAVKADFGKRKLVFRIIVNSMCILVPFAGTLAITQAF